MKHFYWIVIALFTSCSLVDNDQPEPFYIKIDRAEITTKAGQGEPTSNITDVWVYVDNELMGVFQLPATVPYIKAGESEVNVTVFAGIRNNGQVGRPFIYQFLERQEFTVDVTGIEENLGTIVFEYVDNLTFEFIEDFENGNLFTFDVDGTPEATIRTTNEEVKSGNQAGWIHLEENGITSLVKGTSSAYDGLENIGADTYLELDYKNDVPFGVGLVTTQGNSSNANFKIVLDTTSQWNKIYIDFTDELADPTITSYRVIIGSDLTDYGTDEGDVYFDNVKLIHF